MNEPVVIRTIVRILAPFIIMYGLYVQFHGEYSPGGGFQAGVVVAAAFIVYALVYGLDNAQKALSLAVVKTGCALGLILYAGTGVITLLMGGEFLNYSYLLPNPIAGQHLGIIMIEAGVGITVFSVVMVIFYVFAERTR